MSHNAWWEKKYRENKTLLDKQPEFGTQFITINRQEYHMKDYHQSRKEPNHYGISPERRPSCRKRKHTPPHTPNTHTHPIQWKYQKHMEKNIPETETKYPQKISICNDHLPPLTSHIHSKTPYFSTKLIIPPTTPIHEINVNYPIKTEKYTTLTFFWTNPPWKPAQKIHHISKMPFTGNVAPPPTNSFTKEDTGKNNPCPKLQKIIHHFLK